MEDMAVVLNSLSHAGRVVQHLQKHQFMNLILGTK